MPAVWNLARTYSPQIMLPVAMVIGYVGYKIESKFSRHREEKSKSVVVSSVFSDRIKTGSI